jgi:hypothetical protein
MKFFEASLHLNRVYRDCNRPHPFIKPSTTKSSHIASLAASLLHTYIEAYLLPCHAARKPAKERQADSCSGLLVERLTKSHATMVPLPFQCPFSQFLLPNKQRAILVCTRSGYKAPCSSQTPGIRSLFVDLHSIVRLPQNSCQSSMRLQIHDIHSRMLEHKEQQGFSMTL